MRAREEQAGRLEPSQSLLRNASSPERGSFICANRKKKKLPLGGADALAPERVLHTKKENAMNLGAFMNPEFPIFSTTLCYLEREDAYLMLHRIKKQDDYNHDKWIGVGG